jgi:cobalt/nickel transport system permease protein
VAGVGAALFVRAYERGERVHLARAARAVDGPGPEAAGRRAGATDWLLALAPAAVAATVTLAA